MRIENIDIQKNSWSLEIDGNSIKVTNQFPGSKLFVNNKLQDVQIIALFEAHFTGKLPDGKEIKVIVGGIFKDYCYIFVDNELVLED